ncbi:RNA polymerase sigma factor [Glaciecola petra]|uniref:RNA polymerase sigma factor n=1 Tax=Glaciecola petra TaxID=3075602 RepID=A0ABU2ZRL7_9ALTE|nr:RNA polymerase sigma factor [Aestuariibacter sp. P117]MDT0595272.1 RNA polymerase sigma factor [Aestuariibacter sp. P117]
MKELADLVKDAFKLATKIVGEPADAEDILQDAAALALSYKTAPSHQSPDFRPWFYKVVRNKSIDKLRQNKRQAANKISNEAEQEAFNSKVFNPESGLIIEEQKALLNQALQDIDIKYREIIMLKDYHDFSYQQIAEILGIAKGSVMSRLHRARAALGNKLITLSS